MSNKLKDSVLKIIDNKFAQNINVIDFERTNPFTDYFIICDVDSSRQIDGIINELVRLDKEDELDIRAIDGQADSGWVVIDLYDVVVHVFNKEMRELYELDKLFLNYPQTLKADVS